MNDIITDIKALQEETLLNLQSSKASNTVRAYKSDLEGLKQTNLVKVLQKLYPTLIVLNTVP